MMWYIYKVFLAEKRIKRTLSDGTVRTYRRYVLLTGVWDKRERRHKQKHIAYVGTRPVISLAKAREICRRKGLKLEELKKVRGLRIR